MTIVLPATIPTRVCSFRQRTQEHECENLGIMTQIQTKLRIEYPMHEQQSATSVLVQPGKSVLHAQQIISSYQVQIRDMIHVQLDRLKLEPPSVNLVLKHAQPETEMLRSSERPVLTLMLQLLALESAFATRDYSTAVQGIQ